MTNLPRRVDDVAFVVLAVVCDRLREGVLDRGVVVLYVRVLHILHHQRALACDERVNNRGKARRQERTNPRLATRALRSCAF